MEVSTPIRLVITDDHPLIAKGVQTVLSRISAINVVAVYQSAAELLQNIKSAQPDVLILDRQLPQSDSVETTRALLTLVPGLRILVFSSSDAIYHVRRMLDAGCRGYLIKNADEDMLLHAIETVVKGEMYLSPSLEKELLETITDPLKKGKKITLTKREKEVMNLIIREYTNTEIAARLFLSLSTIESHRSSILQKLGVKNTAGIVRIAYETGLV